VTPHAHASFGFAMDTTTASTDPIILQPISTNPPPTLLC
jgi:hypothetical protein